MRLSCAIFPERKATFPQEHFRLSGLNKVRHIEVLYVGRLCSLEAFLSVSQTATWLGPAVVEAFLTAQNIGLHGLHDKLPLHGQDGHFCRSRLISGCEHGHDRGPNRPWLWRETVSFSSILQTQLLLSRGPYLSGISIHVSPALVGTQLTQHKFQVIGGGSL